MYLVGTICSKNSLIEFSRKEASNTGCSFADTAFLVDTFVSLCFATTGILALLALNQCNLGPLNAMLTLGSRQVEMLLGFSIFIIIADALLFCMRRRTERILDEMESAKLKDQPSQKTPNQDQAEIKRLKEEAAQLQQLRADYERKIQENEALHQTELGKLQTENKKLKEIRKRLEEKNKALQEKYDLISIEIERAANSLRKNNQQNRSNALVFDPNEEY